MNKHVSVLAQPMAIGSVALRNRLLLAPITTNYGDERGYATERSFSFYEERARGGAGALIFEASSTSPKARLSVRQHGLFDDSFIPGLAEVAKRVHAHDCRLFVQICHGGPKSSSATNGVQPVSASDLPVKAADIPRPITREEISQAVEDFAAAAARAREAGFDGIELHAAHFYLLSSFLSGYLNRRTDEYGGSIENRARLTCEVIRAVKARTGQEYPVIVRINGRERLEQGIDDAQAQQIARLLVEAGADAIHVSASTMSVNKSIEHLYALKVGGPSSRETPFGCFLEYATNVKKAVDVPVIAVGKLNEIELAERVVREGLADAVAIGRGLVADPYLPEKWLSGRSGEVVQCWGCLACHTTLQTGRDVDCAMNHEPWRAKGQKGT